jgi:prolipoprotein diacylglyceryl transferase
MEWNLDPVALDLGFFEIRWYGICFMIGLLLGATALPRALERRGMPKEHAGALTIWVPVGMIIGAHLVHLIFYEPRSFIDNPRRIIEIGLGLASHGGGLGCIVATWLYSRKHKLDLHTMLDIVVTGTVWVIPMVRLGNFANSEIYGRITDVPWGVVFVRHGFHHARHPSQLYEALIGFALVGLTWFLEHKRKGKLRPGALFYFVIGLYFISRFLIEWAKEYQVLTPSSPFTMGQLLSVPFILYFMYMAFFSKKHTILKPPDPEPDQATQTDGEMPADDKPADAPPDAPKTDEPATDASAPDP